MAKYDITFTCGHTDRINLIGPHASRASRITYLESGECFDCYKNRTTEESRQKAVEYELPPLTGTEKQIAWAESIRITILEAVEKEVAHITDEKDTEPYRLLLMTVDAISNTTAAKQWIEWRDLSAQTIIHQAYRTLQTTPTDAQKEARIAEQKHSEATKAAVIAAATLRPEHPITETIAEMRITGSVIAIIFPEKRDDFRESVKSLGYAWDDGRWVRTIGKWHGDVMDRAIEAGCTLLASGFSVCILDDELRNRIITGTYEPECTRWITKRIVGEYAGWFAIQWGRDESFYDAARKITGSRYSKPHVVVPAQQVDQVLDFAQMYGFRLSDGAQSLADLTQTTRAAMMTVQPPPKPRKTPKRQSHEIPDVLVIPTTSEIHDQLRDD